MVEHLTNNQDTVGLNLTEIAFSHLLCPVVNDLNYLLNVNKYLGGIKKVTSNISHCTIQSGFDEKRSSLRF